jgi:hypothetical protein
VSRRERAGEGQLWSLGERAGEGQVLSLGERKKLFFGPWHEKGEWLEEGGEWGPNEGLRHASGR